VNTFFHYKIPSFPGITLASVNQEKKMPSQEKSLWLTVQEANLRRDRFFNRDRHDADALLAIGQGLIDQHAFSHSKEGVILAYHHIEARLDPRAPLANDDIARQDVLAGEFFDTQSLPIAIAAVPN
jgi:hypothetical protein